MTLEIELKSINDFNNLTSEDLDTLIEKMLNKIGSTDSELRDTLIYSTFGKLIKEDYLNEKQLIYILKVCQNNLFHCIGEIQSDTVFVRSFSSLMIALIVQKDRHKPFLTDDTILKVSKDSITYLKLEKDIRGFVEGKGWAHSIAHGADLLTQTIKHPTFNDRFSLECLETIKLCLFKGTTTNTPFIDDEEERLIFIIVSLLDKGITHDELETWILDVSDTLDELKEKEGHSLNFFWKRSNTINFLRGLYFRLLYKNESLKLRRSIANILEKLHQQLYKPID